jgi:Bacterial regulatory proteins, lacI family
MSHATVKDIAKLAGVSTATVSRVINASSNVSPNIRAAVITAIDQLKYIPNGNAAELALIAAIKRRRDCTWEAPAVSNRPKKRRLDLSQTHAEDAGACGMVTLEKQIEELRETFHQLEMQLTRIEYALAKPGRLTARRYSILPDGIDRITAHDAARPSKIGRT